MISKAMDWLEAKVSSAKQIHQAIYKEEQPLAITTTNWPIYTIGTNWPISTIGNQPNYGLGQQNSTYTIGIGGGSGIGTYNLPAPSGSIIAAQVYDAMGQIITISIDQAYYHTLQQIMAMQAVTYGLAAQSTQYYTPPPKMIEGEFSLDEMDKAEELIAELEHA